jgi:pilus assembly protein TadC
MKLELTNEFVATFISYLFFSLSLISQKLNWTGDETYIIGDPSLEYAVGDILLLVIILLIVFNAQIMIYHQIKSSRDKYQRSVRRTKYIKEL